MSQNTKIEWATHTFNPWEGCTKVSPGCAHCYAEIRNARFGGGSAPNWGKGAPRRRTSEANWKLPLKWNREQEKITARFVTRTEGSRPGVFCASLADWLDDEVPIQWLADLLDLIRCTPNLDWLLLTKRPQNWLARLTAVRHHLNGISDSGPAFFWLADWMEGSPPPNVWIGTTVEDQKRADERIPLLLAIPAKVRFLSCEPLLGPLDLCNLFPLSINHQPSTINQSSIHWVIAGGESGHDSRPMHREWAQGLRDHCLSYQVPFFFKQWGQWSPLAPIGKSGAFDFSDGKMLANDGTCYHPSDIAYPNGPRRGEAIRSNHHQASLMMVYPVGKQSAGRLLDGQEWNQMPSVPLS